MQIPQGTVRTLALKPINLDEDDDDDEDVTDGQDPTLLENNNNNGTAGEDGDQGNQQGNRTLGGVGGDSNATSMFMSAMDDEGVRGGGNGNRSLKPWASLGGESTMSGTGQASVRRGGNFDDDEDDGRPRGSIWSKMAAIATFGRVRARVSPAPMAGSKRMLQRSNDAAIWLVSFSLATGQ